MLLHLDISNISNFLYLSLSGGFQAPTLTFARFANKDSTTTTTPESVKTCIHTSESTHIRAKRVVPVIVDPLKHFADVYFLLHHSKFAMDRVLPILNELNRVIS
jgi:hypothetical protein